ncbi:MAG TPA: hypothetical protein GXX33_07915 [Firmicutes bacterium]|nr:hypothetical protein [Bacillota bacterium]
MRLLTTIILAIGLVVALATTALGAWENTVWLGTDIAQNGREMGYRHLDDVTTKIVSSQVQGVFRSEIQIGSTLVDFENNTGLYAAVGASVNGRLDFLFGAGFIYSSYYSPFLLSGGVKCLVPSKLVVYEVEAFYQILPPLLIHLGYSSEGNALFLGLGLSYN